ncbi:MAG: EF2563 family selenium-dependent molybdenum hydroxylase system protein [Pseudodesulfovibrio sp.]|nr:EF2563 family selenium-dependent molybdenum hydroxylase system protein [Pseudodesulfovibrio sp.]
MSNLTSPTIVIRGAGDLATGVALRLHRAGFKKIVLLETDHPLAVRRTVAFSEAVYHGRMTVEGITAVFLGTAECVPDIWATGDIPILSDPAAETLHIIRPEVLIDAIIAKRNLGTNMSQAPLVIGLGPGFVAGEDVHRIVETKRGHHLGRVITAGSAEPNTGIPGNIDGYTIERVYWAENQGMFSTSLNIGDMIAAGDTLGTVDNVPVIVNISGVVRGLLRNGTPVSKKTKLGDVDPRGIISYCGEASDKALSIGGGVLEAITAHMFSGENA